MSTPPRGRERRVIFAFPVEVRPTWRYVLSGEPALEGDDPGERCLDCRLSNGDTCSTSSASTRGTSRNFIRAGCRARSPWKRTGDASSRERTQRRPHPPLPRWPQRRMVARTPTGTATEPSRTATATATDPWPQPQLRWPRSSARRRLVGGGVPRGRPRDGHRRDRAAEPRRAPRQRVPRSRAPLRERRPARGPHARGPRARALALRPERGRPRQDVLDRRHGGPARARARCARSSPTSSETYCSSIGVEYTHIEEPEPRMWLQQQMESTRNRALLDRTELLRILTKLTDAEIFEQFIHKNYVGAKRFSLEGAESMIPMIDLLVEAAGAARHRGDRHRHGPPRAPQRARERHGQERARDLRRVRRQEARALPRRGRREVPPRLLERGHDAGRPSRSTCRWRSTRATSSS